MNRSLRVAIDAHMVGHRETGNETYVVGLLRGFATDAGPYSFQVLTTDPHRLTSELSLPVEFRIVKVWPQISALRIPFALPMALKRNKANLLHSTYILPPRAPCPMIVTVHDVSFFGLPQVLPVRTRLLLRALVPSSLRVATRVIAISEYTKQDLVRYCGIPPDKIRTTHLAADAVFRPQERSDKDHLPEAVHEPYVLAVGNLEPRKNLSRLIDAFSALLRGHHFDGQLVLCGNPGRDRQALLRQLRLLGLESRVICTGYVAKEQLRSLYNRASVFAFPSLYEGFGLPAIEAMACGCPVIVSNVTALPEVVGDAALKVDPRSTAELVNAIQQVLLRPNLAEDLKRRGLERANLFSWQKTADETRKIYDEALDSSKH